MHGTVRLEVVTTESETLLGTTEIEVSELRRRRTDLNGKVSDPPAGRYYKLSSGVEGDDEDAGLVFLQATPIPPSPIRNNKNHCSVSSRCVC